MLLSPSLPHFSPFRERERVTERERERMSHVSQLIQGHFFETMSEIDSHEDQVEGRNSLRESEREREKPRERERERETCEQRHTIVTQTIVTQ